MKKEIIVLLLNLFCIFSLQGRSPIVGVLQESTGFILNCHFNGLPDNTKVYLLTDKRDTILSTISSGEKFTFKGKLPLDGRFHFIFFDTLVTKVFSKAIFLMNRSMTLSGIVGKREINIEGSPGQVDYNNLLLTLEPIMERRREIIQDIRDLRKSNSDKAIKDSSFIRIQKQKNTELSQKLLAIQEEANQAGLKWIASHKASLYAPFAIIGHRDVFASGDMQKAYEQLTNDAKIGYYGVALNNSLETFKSSKLIKKGAVIPNFSIKTPKGEKIFIHDVAAKSKYTLIDCWASWCSPCRAEIPSLKKLYADYKDKGFNIIGVSSDTKEVQWIKAIEEDKTVWMHGLQSEYKIVSKLFDIKAIPAYILIDNKGKILAFDCAMSDIPSFGGSLRGEEGYKNIAKLFYELGTRAEL